MHFSSAVVSTTALLLATTAIATPILDQRADDDRFTFYPMKTPLAGPCDLVDGVDGALWGEDILVNKIFRVDPHTGDVTEYPIPFTTPLSNASIPVISGVVAEVGDRVAFSCAIRNGADGNIYAGNGVNNQLVRINPTTKAIKVFEPEPANPLGNLFPFNDLYTAAEGMWLTQTTGNTFQFFNYSTERFTTYTVPTPLALPLGCFVASDAKVYIAELNANKILVFDPKDESKKEVTLPQLAQFPAVIRAEHDGWVYFSLFVGNGIGRINMASHAIELYHTNQTGNLGSETTIDSNGGVWLSSFDLDVIARLDTTSFQYEYVAFPGTFAAAGVNGVPGDIPPYVDVAVNYGPGNAIWFGSVLKNSVGRYSLD